MMVMMNHRWCCATAQYAQQLNVPAPGTHIQASLQRVTLDNMGVQAQYTEVVETKAPVSCQRLMYTKHNPIKYGGEVPAGNPHDFNSK